MRIVFFSTSMGQGHNSASAAMKERPEARGAEVKTLNTVFNCLLIILGV